MTEASSSSVAPPRTASRKLTSLAPNKHTCRDNQGHSGSSQQQVSIYRAMGLPLPF
jgi:hypothetical protein